MTVLSRIAVIVATTLLVGCGVSVQPRVGMGDGDGFGRGGSLGTPQVPRPGSLPGATPGRPAGGPIESAMIDYVCRAAPMPSGWIAIAYQEGGENCVRSTDPDNPFTVAMIQRYDTAPVATTMTVCADQRVPRNWARERGLAPGSGCAGARVGEGQPTAVVIRRIR
jgi:hypothetical protein